MNFILLYHFKKRYLFLCDQNKIVNNYRYITQGLRIEKFLIQFFIILVTLSDRNKTFLFYDVEHTI